MTVGAGPAGLDAAVYGASEGLEGGQACRSSCIEKLPVIFDRHIGPGPYRPAYTQALKFGANVTVAKGATC